MKTCEYCGSKVDKGEKVCPHCGASKFKVDEQNFPPNNPYTSQNKKTYKDEPKDSDEGESKTLGVLSIVFGILIPFVGFILSIIALSKYTDPSNKKLANAGLIISIIMFALSTFSNNVYFM